jgi:hypothetical protein
VDFHALPVPDPYKGAEDRVHKFGVDVIGWGSGAEKARALTNTLRTNPAETRVYLEKLRRAGVTREMAQAWADAYRQEHARAEWLKNRRGLPMNPTPGSRVTLMDLIASLL